MPTILAYSSKLLLDSSFYLLRDVEYLVSCDDE
jgi:hypothetical protein